MALFEKKVKVYEAKGKKAEWKSVQSALKEAGCKKVSGSVWQDEIGPCGCGAKLDIRDFGEGGKIDRDIYNVWVPESDEKLAQEVIAKLLPDYTPYEPKADRLRMV